MSRSHTMAVRLSRLDAERLDKGEISSQEDALVKEASKVDSRLPGARTQVCARNAEEQKLLDERPPHFGTL